MSSDLSVLKELVKTIDHDIYEEMFVNPDYPDEAKAEIKNLLSILKRKPKVTLNKDFNKFIKFVKKVWNGCNEEKILHDVFEEFPSDLYDVIQELIYERDHEGFSVKTEKEFIMYVLSKPSFSFVGEFVKDIEL